VAPDREVLATMSSDRPEAGDFRRGPRDAREAAADRDVPESRSGAEPADDESPEFSRGQPLDDPQPSSRERPELETEEDESTNADVRSDKRDI
jgi:hypothetical protein